MLDVLNRRSRSKPQSTGKKIRFLSARDLLWMEKMHRHGPLPMPYLLRYSQTLGMAENRARDRVTDLFHEKDTPHQGPYFFDPEPQYATRVRNQPRVLDVTPRALKALEERELLRKYAPTHAAGMWWRHEFMLGCFLSSIEIATLETPGLQFIFHDEICERIGSRLAFHISYYNAQGKKTPAVLKPDRAFGIKNLANNTTTLYLVEADRGTETADSAAARKTLLDNNLQYREFIGGLQYKTDLKYKGGLILINLMTKPGRMENHMRDIEPANYMLFKTLPVFDGREFLTPPVMTELFTEPFLRPGREPHVLKK